MNQRLPALIINQPWIDLILSGHKTWEMRSMRTNLRQQIALIEKGSGLVKGLTQIKDVLPPLDYQGMIDASLFHGIPDNLIGIVYERGWRIPWVLDDVHRLKEPVRYAHPNGCVTWVRLTNEESQQVLAASPH